MILLPPELVFSQSSINWCSKKHLYFHSFPLSIALDWPSDRQKRGYGSREYSWGVTGFDRDICNCQMFDKPSSDKVSSVPAFQSREGGTDTQRIPMGGGWHVPLSRLTVTGRWKYEDLIELLLMKREMMILISGMLVLHGHNCSFNFQWPLSTFPLSFTPFPKYSTNNGKRD